jgi:hypothetical protein
MERRSRFSRATTALGVVVTLVALSACGGGDGAEPGGGSQAGGSELAQACGRRVVVQTDWFPEPEHGGTYQLIGGSGRVDKDRGTYSGPIGDTGVELEIRAGGPYTGSQNVTSLMYQDPSILMGYVNTDEAVRNSGNLRTVGVFALLEHSPSALMWDPARYSFDTLDDIGKSQAKVLYFEGTAFIDYLVGKGFIRRDQLDPSYDGSPSRFVSEGDVVQEAFASHEPYKYEHDVPQWRKPVDFMLVSTGGYDPYPANLSVRPEALQDRRECLRLLVPLMQQAQVDYLRDPGPVNQGLLRMVRELASSWTLSEGLVADAVKKLLDLKLAGNGPDGTLGNLDMDRLAQMIDILEPIYAAQRVTTVKADLSPSDIATNDFIDPRIGL